MHILPLSRRTIATLVLLNELRGVACVALYLHHLGWLA